MDPKNLWEKSFSTLLTGTQPEQTTPRIHVKCLGIPYPHHIAFP